LPLRRHRVLQVPETFQIAHLVTSAALVNEMPPHDVQTLCKTRQGTPAMARKPHSHDYTFEMTFARPHTLVRLATLGLGVLLTLSLSNPAFAQWKWKDKSGRVQYSDLPPPPAVSDADILQRPTGSVRKGGPSFAPNAAASAASAPASGPSNAVEPELEAKRKKAAEEEGAKRRAEEEKQKVARAENCQRAKAQLRALEDGMRMARVNEKGEREVLDDKGRAEESKRARDVVGSDCK